MPHAIIPSYLHTLSIPTPFPVGPVNVYLAEGKPLTLVDVGPRYAPARESLTEALTKRGYRVTDLERIVITHAHPDHYGLAAEVARASGAEVLTHAANLPWLDADANARRLAFYGEMLVWAGVPAEVLADLAKMRRGTDRYAEPVHPNGTLADGDVLQLGGEGWQVLHTPGHAGGLVCLYQPERRLLISSDHLIRDISSNPIVEPPDPGQTERPRRLVEYIAQLRRVAELDVALVLPGHGLPITDHHTIIGKRLAFHEARARRILEALEGSALTAHEIANALFTILDPVNRFLVISEVVGHLQRLEVEGQVAHVEQGGVARWRALHD
jgi:glyoxylase-like metal-dependent hydrolase (beta-lactamase superfamily II)